MFIVVSGAATASTSSMDPKPTNQIFTSPAAAGILTNDLVKIMEVEQVFIYNLLKKTSLLFAQKVENLYDFETEK